MGKNCVLHDQSTQCLRLSCWQVKNDACKYLQTIVIGLYAVCEQSFLTLTVYLAQHTLHLFYSCTQPRGLHHPPGIIAERRGVGVLRPKKAIRVLWQKLSSCMWRCPSMTTSNLATSVMAARAAFKIKACTQSSMRTGTPATRIPSVETPASMSARSDLSRICNDCSNAVRAFSKLKEWSWK